MKRGNFNPTSKDRINKSISSNIRLTYNCHTLLETSWQGLPIYQHIWLILGGYLTPNTSQILMKLSQNLQMDIFSILNHIKPNQLLIFSKWPKKSDLDVTFKEPSDGRCLKPDQTNSKSSLKQPKQVGLW